MSLLSAIHIPPNYPGWAIKIVVSILALIGGAALIETHAVLIPSTVGKPLHTTSSGPGMRLFNDSRLHRDDIGEQNHGDPEHYFFHFCLHECREGTRTFSLRTGGA